MNIEQARKALRKTGVANATGDALRSTFADLIKSVHGGDAKVYYKWLQTQESDTEIMAAAKSLLASRSRAWDVLMGII